jgi:hypothetical protein
METPDLDTLWVYLNEVALLDGDYEKHYFWKIGPRQYRDLIVYDDRFIYSVSSPSGNPNDGMIWGMGFQIWRSFDGISLEMTDEYRQQIETRNRVFFEWENWR